MQNEALQLQPFRLLIDGVLPRTRNDLGAAADHRLQRLGPTFEVADLNLETLVLEVAQAFGDGERQIVERGLAAHRDADLGLFRLGLRLRVERQQQREGGACGRDQTATELHRFLQWRVLRISCGSLVAATLAMERRCSHSASGLSTRKRVVAPHQTEGVASSTGKGCRSPTFPAFTTWPGSACPTISSRRCEASSIRSRSTPVS